MVISIHNLFPPSFNCPQFLELANISQKMSMDEFYSLPVPMLQETINIAYQFLAPRNIEQLCKINGLNKLQEATILITAEMCAEALDSAFEDMQGQ